MSTTEQLLSLLQDTANILQKTQTNLKKCSKARLTRGYLESRLKNIEHYWSIFQSAHQDLLKCTPTERRMDIPYLVNEDYYIHEDLYFCLSGDIKDMLSSFSSGKCNHTATDSSITGDKVKLPRVQPPVFSGSYEDWPTFQDIFESLIHNNSSLTNVVKLHFLKNSVSGEAQALLKHIQVTDANYEEAWKTLKNRYGNKRIIVNAIMKRLFSQKKLYSQTANQIKSLLDTTTECLNSLSNLKVSVESWDPMIVHLIVSKLDTETHKDWEEYSFKSTPDDLPKWSELRTFLETKFRTLEFIHHTTSTAPSSSRPATQKTFHLTSPAPSNVQSSLNTTSPATSIRTCIKCNDNHTLSHCKDFASMDVAERNDYVKTNNLCYNCLLSGHSVFKCRLPTSCQICHKRHHSLLHHTKNEDIKAHLNQMEENNDDDSDDVPKEDRENDITIATHFITKKTDALLATTLVLVKGHKGQVLTLRALIDQGSEANFITERAVQMMKLHKTPVRGSATGLQSMKTSVNSMVQCELQSRFDTNFNLNINAFVLSTRVTTELPSKALTNTHHAWQHLNGLDLADPKYHQPGRVDMLLGVKVYAQILLNGLIKGPPGSPCTQNTSLGWIVFGDAEGISSKNIVVMHHKFDLDLLVKNMWELDSAEKPELTADEKLCESIYANTTTRTKEGRYVVKLPTRTDKLKSTEGQTRDIALRRFKQLERKFEKDKEFKREYTKVIEEYSTLKHMEEVPDTEIETPSVYLPHHAVIRNDKNTKVRAVFDASSKGTNNISLNEELLVGPQLQEDLRNIIMRWRMKRICFVADIQKMYRQILVTKQDADLQRILWRKSAADPIKEYRLLRVTFGTASAPYLAVKTLQRVAEDEGKHHPVAAKTIKEDFYMDDLMSGQDNVEDAVDVAKNVAKTLKNGGFDLQKWSSNSTNFLKQFPPDERNSNVNMDINLDGTVRALGITWNMGEDSFQYKLELPQQPSTITKRNILAETQKLFDPLGWLAPSIIQAKMLIQKLWLHRSSWDDEVQLEIKEEWLNIRHNFENLKDVHIPRWLHTTKLRLDKTTIHGFSDASTKAYAAVAYLRVETEEGDIKTNIIAAKVRVSPVKPVSLPRLELCGAALLAKLLKQIREAMRIPESQVVAWTDSTIVLSWLKGDPNRWQTFVRNRVVSILDDIGDKWYHVPSQSNPADIASRGSPLPELISHHLWWNGPEWLKTHDILFNKPDTTTDLEMKRTFHTNLTVQEEDNYSIVNQFDDFDDLQELIKTITYCRRFLNYKKLTPNPIFTTEELQNSLISCIKLVQKHAFNDDITRLKNNKNVRCDSKLKSLNPYLDEVHVLRVGGRLKHANLSEDSKNPIILDSKNRLTFFLVADAHQRTLHGGQQLMMCYLKSKYWILKMKQKVRSYIHKCLICARQNATAKKQLMGDLPKERVTPARPFLNSGVDFAGPYQTLMSKGRGLRTIKSYIAIFVCMVTKAIHLELVGDLTSEAFIGAFRRFVARRGRCAHLWSDQGRNFIGANKALAEAFEEAKLDFDGDIATKLALDGTQWHFVPVYSPNFGGLWESGVKSMKFHLKRVLNSHLTFEEFSTLICQVESCLNSRPYVPIDDDGNANPLTPGHFLIGEAPITIPSPTFKDVNTNVLSRWQHLQKMLNDFWHTWQQNYLSTLQQRTKWTKKEPEFDIGQLVLIKNENLPPGKWLLGRIVAKHPGNDGLTRVYSVKSGENIVKRSISKLCFFPVDVTV
ncbi:uncharacterized protein LOC133533829 [Cydia pomonella]|uniref:uncharacterized protein LOC133533829 n=1 Tax=Cydia pomonella TaxID=82600 RepID=UPI002ADDD340|nr:uncharacterized protein LOC133533829 [Cydia pomonella]